MHIDFSTSSGHSPRQRPKVRASLFPFGNPMGLAPTKPYGELKFFSRPRGFSLIELLCVISISAILVNFAHASYHHGLLKMKRLEATSALLELQSNYTRYFLTHHSYEDATLGAGTENDIFPRSTTNEGNYTLAITSQDATSYVLSADPLSPAVQRDEECGEFTLNQSGERGISGTGSLEHCWGG